MTAFFAALFLLLPQTQQQPTDATALEAQYKTCARHYIPADKCTPEIYEQLKAKDTPDADTDAALQAIEEYRAKLKNPASLQLLEVSVGPNTCKKCVPGDRAVCLHVSAQNGLGGVTEAYGSRYTIDGRSYWVDWPWSKCKHSPSITDKVKEALKNTQ